FWKLFSINQENPPNGGTSASSPDICYKISEISSFVCDLLPEIKNRNRVIFAVSRIQLLNIVAEISDNFLIRFFIPEIELAMLEVFNSFRKTIHFISDKIS